MTQLLACEGGNARLSRTPGSASLFPFGSEKKVFEAEIQGLVGGYDHFAALRKNVSKVVHKVLRSPEHVEGLLKWYFEDAIDYEMYMNWEASEDDILRKLLIDYTLLKIEKRKSVTPKSKRCPGYGTRLLDRPVVPRLRKPSSAAPYISLKQGRRERRRRR